MSRINLREHLRALRGKLCELCVLLASRVEVVQQKALLAQEHVSAAIEEKAAGLCFDVDAVAEEASSLRERIETVKSEKIVVLEQTLVGVDACIERLDGLECLAEAACSDLARDAEALLAATKPIELTVLGFVRARARRAWRRECTCASSERDASSPRLGYIASSSLLADNVIVRVEWPSLALFARLMLDFDDDDAQWLLQDVASGFEVCADKVDNSGRHPPRPPLHCRSPVRAHPVQVHPGDRELAFAWSPALHDKGEGEGYALEHLRVTLWGESVTLDTSDVPRQFAHGESGSLRRIDSLETNDVDLVFSQTGKDRNECKEALAAEHGDIVNAIMKICD
jgi:hypothetical protein